MSLSAIIVAAGNGSRIKRFPTESQKQTKQLTPLDGIPVVVRSILQFEECEFVDEIIVVAREDELSFYDDYQFKKVKYVVKGGETRQQSVMNGFKYIKSDYAAIHDGARCLVTTEMIERVAREAYIHGCATAAEKAKDTLKQSDADGFITATVDRSQIWRAQTPQIFKTDIYRAAIEQNIEVTDDCMLVENLGYKIKLVDCGYENIKITTPDDFYLAEAILKVRKNV